MEGLKIWQTIRNGGNAIVKMANLCSIPTKKVLLQTIGRESGFLSVKLASSYSCFAVLQMLLLPKASFGSSKKRKKKVGHQFSWKQKTAKHLVGGAIGRKK